MKKPRVYKLQTFAGGQWSTLRKCTFTEGYDYIKASESPSLLRLIPYRLSTATAYQCTVFQLPVYQHKKNTP